MEAEEVQISDRIIDPKNILLVSIDLIEPNSWNPKDKDTNEYKSVVQSIKTYGLKGFIAVREVYTTNEAGAELRHFEIIDGEQRWRACKELGYKNILIYNEGKLDDKTAQELTLWWQVQVPFNDLSLAKMVTKMLDQYQDVILPFSDKKVEEMRKVSQFDWNGYNNKPPELGSNSAPAELMKTFMVQMTNSQYDIVQQALEKAKKAAGEDITNTKALEFVCAEYINLPDGQ